MGNKKPKKERLKQKKNRKNISKTCCSITVGTRFRRRALQTRFHNPLGHATTAKLTLITIYSHRYFIILFWKKRHLNYRVQSPNSNRILHLTMRANYPQPLLGGLDRLPTHPPHVRRTPHVSLPSSPSKIIRGPRPIPRPPLIFSSTLSLPSSSRSRPHGRCSTHAASCAQEWQLGRAACARRLARRRGASGASPASERSAARRSRLSSSRPAPPHLASRSRSSAAEEAAGRRERLDAQP